MIGEMIEIQMSVFCSSQFAPLTVVEFNHEANALDAFGMMNVMQDGITIALIKIIPQTGTNVPNMLSGMFNPKAIGIATETAITARLEYGGRPEELFFFE